MTFPLMMYLERGSSTKLIGGRSGTIRNDSAVKVGLANKCLVSGCTLLLWRSTCCLGNQSQNASSTTATLASTTDDRVIPILRLSSFTCCNHAAPDQVRAIARLPLQNTTNCSHHVYTIIPYQPSVHPSKATANSS